MSRNRKRLARITAILLGVAAVGLLMQYAIIEPNSAIGTRLFRLRYASATDKPHFLTRFSLELTRFEGGTIRDGIDTYLSNRFVVTPSEAERSGIADFYVRQQRRGRPGHHLHDMGEPFVERLFQRLPHYDADHQLAALAAMEGCRRAKSIMKLGFTPLANAVERHQLPLETVIGAYHRWWQTPLAWPRKVELNPIADLPYDWSEL